MHAKRVEQRYGRQLRGVAEQIGRIIRGFAPEGEVNDEPGLMATLRRYSDLLEPWAWSVSESIVVEIARRDENAWNAAAEEMGVNLRAEIRKAPTGEAMRELMHEQVTLIKSLPLRAAERVHELVIESLSGGARASEIAKEIMRSGHVTKSRATLIARTESARASAHLTQARAQWIGSSHYVWHTAGDSDVRPSHRKLNGKIFRWDDPPVAEENGDRHNPGEFPNCRCFSEPILPGHL